ncbi:MAG: heavy-metal-associated domain-containing protein [Burkholderiales bacterium]|nr:heavy-metal-associated domain-containing protein [Anaerolineae bacterium]
MESKTFVVPNIGCDGCVRTIQNELGEINGVQEVIGDVDSKTVTVKWDDPANWQKIVNVLQEIEYEPAAV